MEVFSIICSIATLAALGVFINLQIGLVKIFKGLHNLLDEQQKALDQEIDQLKNDIMPTYYDNKKN